MYEVARIEDFRVNAAGTELKLFIPKTNYLEYLTAKRVHSCGIWIEDGRHITAEQRKKIYATIRDISLWSGFLPEEQKEWLKYYYMLQTGYPYFSLSGCSIDTAREFLNVILDYVVENGIQLPEPITDRTDDMERAMYSCLRWKKCAVCGQQGEIHHVDTIGMGNDRRRVDDRLYRKICLCRKHHTEAHTIGMDCFEKKYKVYGIIFPETQV